MDKSITRPSVNTSTTSKSQRQFNPLHWRLDLSVTVIILVLILSVLLNKFNNLQLDIEKENVQTQLQYFKLGLAEAWVNRNITYKTSNINAIENTNPMRIIADLPSNYIGEFAQTPLDKKSAWFYHTYLHQLCYILKNGEIFRFQLTSQHVESHLPTGGLDLIEVKE